MGVDDDPLHELRVQLEVERKRKAEAVDQARQLAFRLQQAGEAIVDELQRVRLLRERHAAVLAVARAGSFHWHAPSDRFECDDNVPRLYGVRVAREMRAGDLVARVHEDDRPAMLEGWRRCAERGVPFEVDVRVPDDDGALRWVGVRAHGHTCERGAARCIVGACADTSAVHRAAESDRVANQIPQLVWIASPNGRIEYANERWLGYTGHTLRPDDPAALISAFDSADQLRVRETWLRAIHGGSGFEIEARITCGERESRWFLVRAVPMAAGGVIHRWVGTCTDVDAQKRGEIHLASEHAAQTQAIASLGHELRHPLSSIATAAHVVGKKAPTVEREVTLIERQIGRMARMLDEMLDVARVASGRLALDRRPVLVAEVVDDAVEWCAATIRDRQQSLVVSIDPDLAVDGDADRCVQIFANLLANAAKHTPVGGHIRVRGWRQGLDVAVEVRDDGAGIPAELLPRIFDPFVQGEASPDRSGGIGLGLTIVRSLVQLHGGTITATSEGAGTGSAFAVRLPAAPTPPRRPRAVTETREKRSPKRRILVVDDCPDITDMLCEVLRHEGHETMVALDARSGLELALAEQPDVALIDIYMPSIDGRTLANELRARLGPRCPRLIAITGSAAMSEPEPTFDHVLVKPLDLPFLRAVVAQALPRRRRRTTKRTTRGGDRR